MSAALVLQDMSDVHELGWNDIRRLTIACEFIEHQQAVPAFFAFVQKRALEEVEASAALIRGDAPRQEEDREGD